MKKDCLEEIVLVVIDIRIKENIQTDVLDYVFVYAMDFEEENEKEISKRKCIIVVI